MIVWLAVFLSPAAALSLRAVDESGLPELVVPLQWVYITFFALSLLLGVLVTSARSVIRMAAGLVASLLGLVVLLTPMFNTRLGRTICPPRAGSDLGVRVAASVLEAWRTGAPGSEAWAGGVVDPSWQQRRAAIRLLDYRRVDAGCWERAAPISPNTTWHEFRVTVREGARAPLSKILLVHAVRSGDGWNVSGVDGPLP